MPRPIDIQEEEINTSRAAVEEYIDGRTELEEAALLANQAHDKAKKDLETYRKTHQKKNKLLTEAIEDGIDLVAKKTQRQLEAYLRTLMHTIELKNGRPQGDLFGDYLERGEAAAISNAAA